MPGAKKHAGSSYKSLLVAKSPINLRRGINSVEIGMRVLECVVLLGRPSSLKSIVEKTKLQPSQAHRYVSSLVNCGMLRQDGVTGLYDVGPAALRVGLYAIARQDALAHVDDVARQLSLQERVATTILVWGTSGPTVVKFYRGSPPLYASVSAGSTFPVANSVAGRVFLSFLSEHELRPFLADEGFPGPIESYPELSDHIERVRKNGFETGSSTQIPGLKASAAPIFGLDRTIVAVIAIPCTREINASRFKKLTEQLTDVCRAATKELGGEWPTA